MEPIKLTAVLIEDEKVGGYTAYLEKFPNVISEGDTQEEAVDNLKSAFFTMLEYRSREQAIDIPRSGSGNYDTKTITICT